MFLILRQYVSDLCNATTFPNNQLILERTIRVVCAIRRSKYNQQDGDYSASREIDTRFWFCCSSSCCVCDVPRLNIVFHLPLTSCLCTPNTDFPVAHRHTWRRRHWSHHSQTVAQHSAGSRHTDPLHTLSPVGPTTVKTHHGLSASLLHMSTQPALPGQKTKLAPQISRFLRTLLRSPNADTLQAQASPQQHCALGKILYSIPHLHHHLVMPVTYQHTYFRVASMAVEQGNVWLPYCTTVTS